MCWSLETNHWSMNKKHCLLICKICATSSNEHGIENVFKYTVQSLKTDTVLMLNVFTAKAHWFWPNEPNTWPDLSQYSDLNL